MRIPGTLNAKGDNTPERPHRRVRLLSTPEDLVTVDVELLAAVAKPERPTTNDEAAPSKPGTASTHDTTVDIEKMTAWLEEHELDSRNGKPWKGTGYRWELESCPVQPRSRSRRSLGRCNAQRRQGGRVLTQFLHLEMVGPPSQS